MKGGPGGQMFINKTTSLGLCQHIHKASLKSALNSVAGRPLVLLEHLSD